jgi:hypothetical protein
MAVGLGSITPSNFFLGSSQVQFLFMGSNRVWPVGSLIPSASFGSGFNFRALAALQPIGEQAIEVFGDLFSYKGSPAFRAANIQYDGTLNTTYAANVSASLVHTFSANGVYNARQDSTGAVFVTNDGGKIVKLNANGTKATSFNPGIGFTGTGQIQPDVLFSGSSLVVTTPFASNTGSIRYKNNTIGNISILDANGTVQNVGNWYEAEREGWMIYNRDLTLLPNNQYLLCNVLRFQDVPVTNNVVRLNANLTRDTGYTAPFAINSVCGFTLLASGKIFCQGENDDTRRLNSDGTNDAGFTSVNILSNAIKYTLELSDGKLLLVGNFTSVNGNSNYQYMAMLNSDGSLFTGFQMGATGITGGEQVIYSAVEVDEFIYLVGSFTAFKGVAANNIIRVNKIGAIA